MGGLTPQILQQMMQSSQQTVPQSNPLLQGQPQASALPQTSPVQPQGMASGGQVDPNTALAQFQSNPAISGPNAQLNSISQQESDVQNKLSNMQIPKTG